MHRPTELFAEPIYQAAFDRGANEALRLFGRLRAASEPIPAEWPRSKEAAALLIEDLLFPDLAASAKHLAITCAYSGAWIQWRKSRAGVRSSGVIRRVDVDAALRIGALGQSKLAGE